MLIACIWVANVFGMRPAVWVGYVTGGLLLFPLAVFMFLPVLHGRLELVEPAQQHPLGSSVTGDTGIRLVIVWLYIMCWSSYGFECCATFAPEYKDPARDTAKALRAAAVFSIFVYGLLPLGAVGTFGDQNITARTRWASTASVQDPRRERRGRHARADALRGHHPLDEHRDDGRIARAVRHLPGRHDVPLARAS